MEDQNHTYHVKITRLDGGNWQADAVANTIITDAELAAAGNPIEFVRQAVHDAVDVALDEVGPPNG